MTKLFHAYTNKANQFKNPENKVTFGQTKPRTCKTCYKLISELWETADVIYGEAKGTWL